MKGIKERLTNIIYWINRLIKYYISDALFNFSGTHTLPFSKIPIKLNYDQYWKSQNQVKIAKKLTNREKIIFDLIPKNSRVLDFGCGLSNILFHLHNLKQCSVLGCDISQYAIFYQKKNHVPVKLLQDKNYLKYGKFSYIILSEVLEHMVNPEELITELKKQTTYFIISVPNFGYLAYRLKIFFQGRISLGWTYHPSEHLRYWSHVEFIEWMQALGCTLLSYQCVKGIFSLFNFLPNLLSWNIVYVFKTNN